LRSLAAACGPTDFRVIDSGDVPPGRGEKALRPAEEATLDARTGGDVILADPAAPDVAARPTPVGGTGNGLAPVLAAPAGLEPVERVLGLAPALGTPVPVPDFEVEGP
jgi:hypothetical protein